MRLASTTRMDICRAGASIRARGRVQRNLTSPLLRYGPTVSMPSRGRCTLPRACHRAVLGLSRT
eukprot:scaffold14737_cov68-Phaeocystis_antarctica.AAC.6